MTAVVNRVIDHSCVDGPGNRTAIFFQGCNLRCAYCHNPETIGVCSGCGQCVTLCPAGALSLREGKVHWEEMACRQCDHCIHSCPQSASPRTREMTVGQLLELVRGNLPFIRGITVSGGECSLNRNFLVELFQGARALGLTTLMDSNGLLPIAWDAELMEVCDGVMLDVKCTDPEAHRELTGQDSRPVLENAVRLAALGKLPEIRTVIIPGRLPNERTVREAAALLRPWLDRAEIRYKLIRFRPLGVRGAAQSFPPPDSAYMEQLRELAFREGFREVMVI